MIFYFSSIPDLKVGAPQVSEEISLRKLAHIGEYAVLAWLVYRLLLGVHRQAKLSQAAYGQWDQGSAHAQSAQAVGHRPAAQTVGHKKSLVWAWLFVLLFCISDEIHQTFVAGRAGKVIDVVIDSLGAVLGLQIATIFYFRKMKKITVAGILAVLAVLGSILYYMVIEGRRQALLNQPPMEASEIGKVEIATGDDRVMVEGAQQSSVSASLEATEDPGQPGEAAGKERETGSPEAHQDLENKAAGYSEPELPKKIKVNVPFTSQAPYANWDALHEEACEETSLVMVWAYLKKQPLDQAKAEQEILALAAYQKKKYGNYDDSDMKQLVDIAQDHYGINNLKVVYDFSKEDLKVELAKGKPVILPTAGRRLGNPNFKTPGPLYHNLVAIGYDGQNIITNDPGTRKGKDFIYNEDVLYKAIHDFPGKKEDIEQGRKAMIVIE